MITEYLSKLNSQTQGEQKTMPKIDIIVKNKHQSYQMIITFIIIMPFDDAITQLFTHKIILQNQSAPINSLPKEWIRDLPSPKAMEMTNKVEPT